MTDTPRSNAISPVVFMGSGGPDLTPEAVERLRARLYPRNPSEAYGALRMEADAMIAALSAALEAERASHTATLKDAQDECARAEAAESMLAEMSHCRDHWKALAEGQDFTRIYLDMRAKRDAAKQAARYESDLAEQALQEMKKQKVRAEALDAKLEEAARIVQPFSEMAGELFARNYYKTDTVLMFINEEKGLVRLSFENFIEARAFLASHQKETDT